MSKRDDAKLKVIYKVLYELRIAKVTLESVKKEIVKISSVAKYEIADDAIYNIAMDFLKASERIVKKG